ncbi:SEC-C domain-containing protein [Candidatus Woesearchaeota archaeon]|nr:SEC-C domain-containing protein [Candidatus Woesearchaeota archaeon]
MEELREKIRIEKGKPGKNDPCHCGSEIKYKKCCMEEDLREKERKLRGEG